MQLLHVTECSRHVPHVGELMAHAHVVLPVQTLSASTVKWSARAMGTHRADSSRHSGGCAHATTLPCTAQRQAHVQRGGQQCTLQRAVTRTDDAHASALILSPGTYPTHYCVGVMRLLLLLSLLHQCFHAFARASISSLFCSLLHGHQLTTAFDQYL